ncbi:hypothetical protein Sjap_013256 [Stephania japonica]|uniref:Cytochrome P450 n=1 Tax=Stephania japonica TaxID=461633 RepID=A0AAP0NYZ6_9MAGN
MYGCVDIGFAPYNESIQLREICVMELLSVRRVKTFKTVREEEVVCLIERISRSSSKGASVNLFAMSHILTVHIIFRCAFGRKFSNIDAQNGFADLPEELMSGLLSFSFADSIPILGWLDIVTGLITRLKKTARKLEVNKISKKLTRDKIKALILDMFVSGTETSSRVIEWAMSELIRNPKIMKKAQEEVRRIVREKGKLKLDADIQEMDYLKCVVKEAFRLHPPTPILRRESSQSVNIKGYLLPPKTKVMINAWTIQRDQDTWSCAEEFIPERFIGSKFDFKGLDFEYFPFGSGRRICPGISFGSGVVEIVLANLLFWFDWQMPGGADEKGLDMTDSFQTRGARECPLQLVAAPHFN